VLALALLGAVLVLVLVLLGVALELQLAVLKPVQPLAVLDLAL
jgi:uncharacterized membrane protein